MIDNFIACVGFSLRQEGGFSDVAGDPGGASMHGLTISTLSTYLGRQATVADVRAITDEQAEAIYKPMYWETINGDELPLGIDLSVLDFGINAGPQTSARLLQRTAGASVDGWIGKGTVAAVKSFAPSVLITKLSAAQQAYYSGLPGFAEFGAGWLARGVRRRIIALAMAAAG